MRTTYYYGDASAGALTDGEGRTTGPALAGRPCGHHHRTPAAAAACPYGGGVVVRVSPGIPPETLILHGYDVHGAAIWAPYRHWRRYMP